MGCSNSKDTTTKDQSKQPKGKKDVGQKPQEKNSPQKSNEQNKPKDQEEPDNPWGSKEDAIKYVRAELNVTEEVATRIVEKANKDGDDQIEGNEIKELWNRIKEVQEKLRPKFEEEDKNGDGVISTKAATRIVREKYPNLNEKTTRTLFKRFGDTDGDGKIECGELIVFYYYLEDADKDLRPVFEKADKSKTGTVTLTEARSCLCEKFTKMDKDAVGKMLRKFDNGDAKVEYPEFIMFYAGLKQARNKVVSDFDKWDTNDDGNMSVDYTKKRLAKNTGMEEEDCEGLVYAADKSNDGNISKSEFVSMWSNFC